MPYHNMEPALPSKPYQYVGFDASGATLYHIAAQRNYWIATPARGSNNAIEIVALTLRELSQRLEKL